MKNWLSKLVTSIYIYSAFKFYSGLKNFGDFCSIKKFSTVIYVRLIYDFLQQEYFFFFFFFLLFSYLFSLKKNKLFSYLFGDTVTKMRLSNVRIR